MLEAAQRTAQTPDADAQLMDMLDPQRRVAVEEADRIARDVGQAFIEDRSECLDGVRLIGVFKS